MSRNSHPPQTVNQANLSSTSLHHSSIDCPTVSSTNLLMTYLLFRINFHPQMVCLLSSHQNNVCSGIGLCLSKSFLGLLCSTDLGLRMDFLSIIVNLPIRLSPFLASQNCLSWDYYKIIFSHHWSLNLSSSSSSYYFGVYGFSYSSFFGVSGLGVSSTGGVAGLGVSSTGCSL